MVSLVMWFIMLLIWVSVFFCRFRWFCILLVLSCMCFREVRVWFRFMVVLEVIGLFLVVIRWWLVVICCFRWFILVCLVIINEIDWLNIMLVEIWLFIGLWF